MKSNIGIQQVQKFLVEGWGGRTLLMDSFTLLRNPKWETELIPVGEQEAEMKAINGKFWTLMNQHACLYFASETGRPLNVNSVQSVCLPHVPPVSPGKRKKESGILRSMSHQGNWSNAPLPAARQLPFMSSQPLGMKNTDL